MDINTMMPTSGRILAEDGSVINIVDLLNDGTVLPVSVIKHDIEAYSPRSGRVIGEDGLLYNVVDLLGEASGRSMRESLRMETTGDDVLTIFKGSAIVKENGKVLIFDFDMQIGADNLNGDSFAVGQDYGVFLTNVNDIVISIAETIPVSREIGGFHYGVNRRTNAALQPINTAGVVRGEGWEANIYNGILPRSVWTFLHRPKCNPEGMVYLSSGVWVDIYECGDGENSTLVSKHNVLPTVNLSWYGFTERLLLSGKRLLSYQEFIQAAMGSPPGTEAEIKTHGRQVRSGN